MFQINITPVRIALSTDTATQLELSFINEKCVFLSLLPS
jgi:hypothetical protein